MKLKEKRYFAQFMPPAEHDYIASAYNPYREQFGEDNDPPNEEEEIQGEEEYVRKIKPMHEDVQLMIVKELCFATNDDLDFFTEVLLEIAKERGRI